MRNEVVVKLDNGLQVNVPVDRCQIRHCHSPNWHCSEVCTV